MTSFLPSSSFELEFRLATSDTYRYLNTRNPFLGTAGSDGIQGDDKSNVLLGRGGDDFLTGYGGNDTIRGGSGIDSISYNIALSAPISDKKGVTVDLLKGKAIKRDGSIDRIFNVENIDGSNQRDRITGDGGRNVLAGWGGDDRLSGMGGDDILSGWDGDDILSGGKGADQFAYVSASYGSDIITDFKSGTDTILIVTDFFFSFSRGLSDTLPDGALDKNRFFLGSRANSRRQLFGYNPQNGQLLYDADGSGSGDSQLIATLSGRPQFQASDFFLA